MNSESTNSVVFGAGLTLTALIVLGGFAATTVGVVYFYNKIAKQANSLVGVKEVGNNAGFANVTFENMMRSVGWKGGEAWCMYFAKAVYLKVLPQKAAIINQALNGSTQQSFNNAASGKYPGFTVITSGKPRVGDIVIWQRGSNKGTGHAGIVTAVNSSSFTTVEGNTTVNQTFAGEGDAVYKNQHPLAYGQKTPQYSDLYLRGFIRYNA